MAQHLDAQVEAFRSRPLDAVPFCGPIAGVLCS
jgi:hypothetical protein